MCLIIYSNDHAPLTVRLIYSSSKLRTVQMMIFSLVAMIGLAECCITSACLQWLCHSGERIVARGPLVFLSQSSPILELFPFDKIILKSYICTVVIVMAKQCLSQTVLESGSWGHSVLQTPALVPIYLNRKL